METEPPTNDIQINCFKHPTEKIQRINPSIHSKSHVFCLECLLEENQQQSSQDLLSISEFLTIADGFYKNNPPKPVTELKTPSEYISLLAEQSKVLGDLTEHLLQEKQKVGHLFDQIKREFIESLEEQRTKCLDELDQQLERLRYWHVFFEKKLRMTYPNSATNFNKAFISEESLIKTFEAITDPLQFEAYIRSIKEDLNENFLQLNKTKPFDQDKKFKLPSLSKQLAYLQSTKPSYNISPLKPFPWMDRKKPCNLKTELETPLKDLLERLLVFQNPIPDVLDHCNCPESLIIQAPQYELLKEWLPEEFQYQSLKLLFRGTRDGMQANHFHEKCDNKGPTLTLIHCTFYNSRKESTIGGFLDKDWHSEDKFIDSDKAFLFSLTAKVKCPLKAKIKEKSAAHGSAKLGPTFGRDELCLDTNFRKNYVWTSGFENSELLIDRKNQEPLQSFEDHKLPGMNYFWIHEVEVYTFI